MLNYFTLQVKESGKPVNTEEMKDQGSKHGTLNSPAIILSSGGCKSPMGYHPNGQDWHPVIASHGEQKCIKCKCKVGTQIIYIYFFTFKLGPTELIISSPKIPFLIIAPPVPQ